MNFKCIKMKRALYFFLIVITGLMCATDQAFGQSDGIKLINGFRNTYDELSVAEFTGEDSLKFFHTNFLFDKYFRTGNDIFLSSIDAKLIYRFSLNGAFVESFKPTGSLRENTRKMYNPDFYTDDSYIYWGRYTDLHMFRIEPGKKFKARDIISFEQPWLPPRKPAFKFLNFNDDVILVYIPRSSSVSYVDPHAIAFLYKYNESDSATLLYKCQSESPVPSKINLPRFPHLDIANYEDVLVVWDAYNLNLLFLDANYKTINQVSFTREELGVVPYRCCDGGTPFINRVKFTIDEVTDRIYFVIKNEDENERLIRIEMDNAYSITGFVEQPTLDLPDNEIRQVFDNKVYYTFSVNGNQYICEQAIKH